MPNHNEEIRRFFSTPPPETDAEFEAYFEKFVQEIDFKEVIRERDHFQRERDHVQRERDHFQERYNALHEKHNQLQEEKSPVPDGLPFVAFMCEAIKELQLPRPILKSEIEDWLRNNWPDYLRRISDRKISVMATFLRSVDAQQGGWWRDSN